MKKLSHMYSTLLFGLYSIIMLLVMLAPSFLLVVEESSEWVSGYALAFRMSDFGIVAVLQFCLLISLLGLLAAFVARMFLEKPWLEKAALTLTVLSIIFAAADFLFAVIFCLSTQTRTALCIGQFVQLIVPAVAFVLYRFCYAETFAILERKWFGVAEVRHTEVETLPNQPKTAKARDNKPLNRKEEAHKLLFEGRENDKPHEGI